MKFPKYFNCDEKVAVNKDQISHNVYNNNPIRFVAILTVMMRLVHTFTRVTTAQLSLYAQNCGLVSSWFVMSYQHIYLFIYLFYKILIMST